MAKRRGEGRRWRKYREAAEKKLAENESLLTPIHTGRFTEEGLVIYTEEEVFDDPAVADLTPYSDLSIYYFTERALPHREGREEKMIVVGTEEGGICLPMNDRTEALAISHGVKAADKRFPPQKQKRVARFYYRSPRYGKKQAILFSLLALLALGLVIAGALLGGFRPEALGYFLGVCAIILGCASAACGLLLRREKLVVYERGIRLCFFLRGCDLFLPEEAIEHIRKEGDDMVIDVGFTNFCLPDRGVFRFLTERFPDKAYKEQTEDA